MGAPIAVRHAAAPQSAGVAVAAAAQTAHLPALQPLQEDPDWQQSLLPTFHETEQQEAQILQGIEGARKASLALGMCC